MLVIQAEDSDNETEIMKLDLNSELKRGELVTVADGEGQQYVVLEVIQLEDGSEQQVAVVAPDFIDEEQGTYISHFVRELTIKCSFV